MWKNPISVPIRVHKTNEMTVEVRAGEELVFLVPGTNWGWECSQRIITIKQVGTKLVRLFWHLSQREAETGGGGCGGQRVTIVSPAIQDQEEEGWLASDLKRVLPPSTNPSPAQGLHFSLIPVLSEQFAQLRSSCLVTWMVSVLSCSSLCLSLLAHLGKKANLVPKGRGGQVRVSFSAPASQVQSYSLPPYNLCWT